MINLKLVTLLIWVTFVSSRLYQTSYAINQIRRSKGWIFLDRMRFDQKIARITFTSKININNPSNEKNYIIELGIVPDSQWKQQSVLKCQKNSKRQNSESSPLKQVRIINIMNSTNSLTSTNTIQISVPEETTYHFILRDCKKELINEYFSSDIYLDISLRMLNNYQQIGEQQQFNGIILFILITFTIVMIYLSKQWKQKIDNQYDWWKILLHIGLWFNLFGLCIKLFNFLIYAFINGVQYGIFDFFYLFMHSLSQSIITSLLIFVSYGWTVTFINGNDFDLYIPLRNQQCYIVSMLGIVNIILTILNKINDNEYDKYHMYDSIPAYILAFFRFITVFIFIIGIIVSLYNSKSSKVKQFFGKFLILGLLYFLSLPFLMTICYMLSETVRAEFIFLSVELIKTAVNMILTYMVSSKNSNYKGVKFSNQSFMELDGRKYL